MTRNIHISIALVFLLVVGILYVSHSSTEAPVSIGVETTLAAEFERLSKSGNSSCMGSFSDSIDEMSNSEHLQGSCCSPMDMHRYEEQVNGLKHFKSISGQNIIEIPDDPYNVDVDLAKRLKGYYNLELTPEAQVAYDYAVEHSMEKGPCCCKCWRWYVYGGLAKYLIIEHGFTGEQITQVWNLSDGCGGAEDHSGH